MFPYIGNHILEYDYRLDSVTIMGDMESQDIKAAKCYEIVETKIYMVGSGSNNVYRYDFTNHSYIKKNVGDKSNKFWGIKKAGQYFVLPRLDKKVIILWNEENGKVIELTKFPEHYAYSEGRAYLDMFEWKGDMYIFPFYANMILKIDVENKLITQAFSDILCMPNYDTNTEGFSSETYLCVGRYQNYIYAYATYKKCLQIFDLDAISIQDISLSEIKKEEHKKLVENILNNEIYAESFCEVENASICNLENYIVNVQIIDRESGVNNISKTCIGQNIYKQIIDI